MQTMLATLCYAVTESAIVFFNRLIAGRVELLILDGERMWRCGDESATRLGIGGRFEVATACTSDTRLTEPSIDQVG